jgi:Flp pilus assembly protein TadG
MRPTQSAKRANERGFSLLTTAVCLTVMVAMVGLAVDLGRMYVVKTELQAYADAAASAAAFELDGTTAGITSARNLASTGPGASTARNNYNMGTQQVPTVQSSFSTSPTGTFETNPGTATGYRFVLVNASGPVSLSFLPVLPGISTAYTVSAQAVAGQGLVNSMSNGADPFSPDAQNTSDANFGYTKGQLYTLKWAPPGQRNKSGGRCAGDATFDPGGGSSDRGYIDIGQGNGNSALYDAIVNGEYGLENPLTIGSYIDTVPGNKHVGPAMQDRFDQDTDTTAQTYSQYTGNGRRLMRVPVNDGGNRGRVIGFALFFLPPNACGSNNEPCCGEYVSNTPVISGENSGAGTSGGLYKVQLFR